MPRLLPILALLSMTASVALAAPTAGRLQISADPQGAMRFDKTVLRAKPGRVTITMANPSVIPHNVAIRGQRLKKVGKVVLKGGTSRVTATLRAGRYVFYCSVAGHEQAGMKGVLSVR